MEELIDIHLNAQLYLLNRIENKDYDIIYSDVIDDQYFNFAYLKSNKIDIKELYVGIKNDMEKLKRRPVIYITSNICNSSLEEQIENSNMKLLYTDVWMVIDNLEQFGTYKSNLNFSVNKADEDLKEKFIQAIMDTFSGNDPEEPYENLSDGYRVALRESFKENNSEYKVLHYAGMYENEVISTATAVYKKDKAIIYNVTTNRKNQKQGVCKQMMSEIIKDLKDLGITTVCLQTEKGFYTEQVYKNMGFREVLLGKAYCI